MAPASADIRWRPAGGRPTDLMTYLPGVSQQEANTNAVDYFVGDQIGTSRAVSDQLSALSRKVVYTAFGEVVEVLGDGRTRYGYAGAWGYQEHDVGSNGCVGTNGCGSPGPDGLPDNWVFATPGAVFPYLHVGYRYYDPSTGRFLQRDPIGTRGGLNVHEYVGSAPTIAHDADGLMTPKWRQQKRLPTGRFGPKKLIYRKVPGGVGLAYGAACYVVEGGYWVAGEEYPGDPHSVLLDTAKNLLEALKRHWEDEKKRKEHPEIFAPPVPTPPTPQPPAPEPKIPCGPHY